MLPYVYKLTDRETGQFYFGFRCANKLSPEQDLGSVYKTSSKYVKKNFEKFDAQIIAVFTNRNSAYKLEQFLIKENFENPLILNKHWQSTEEYTMKGFKRPDLSESNRQNKSKPKEERQYVCGGCGSEFSRTEFCHHPIKETRFCTQKCRWLRQSKPVKEKSSRVAWNKGKSNPTAAENGKRGAEKLAKTVKGRKRKYKEDGSWVWEYPTS